MTSKQWRILAVAIPFALFCILFGVLVVGNALFDSLRDHQAQVATGKGGFNNLGIFLDLIAGTLMMWIGIIIALLPWIDLDKK